MPDEKRMKSAKLNKAVGKLVTQCMTELVEDFERLKSESVPVGKPVPFFVAGDNATEPTGHLMVDHRGILRYEIGIVREEGRIRITRFKKMYKEALNELGLADS